MTDRPIPDETREPVAWRYRYLFGGKWDKWTVQKNKPYWWTPKQVDVELEPLFTRDDLLEAEKRGMRRGAEIAKAVILDARMGEIDTDLRSISHIIQSRALTEIGGGK